ncbi:hypothetical protein ACFQHW_07535 [Lapidilactobacillus achengensis]|uniref:Uncharacterized protein n=1 Tax=Lapidilactobacillus achengensis TaxID=2486000 RepID=A0ABW1UN63_9LACO
MTKWFRKLEVKRFPAFEVVRQCQLILEAWTLFLNLFLMAEVVVVARERNRLGLLMRTGTWWASFEANPQSARLVFKSSLVLSGKAAKDNFTTEPRSPSRLLGRIELICNRSEGFDEVVSQARGQNNRPLFRWDIKANGFRKSGLSS